MKPIRYRRRGIATLVVLSATALAIAAGNPLALSVTPRISVKRHVTPAGGSNAVTLKNANPQPFDVGSITYDCGAPPAMRLQGGSGSNPFTIPGNNGTQTVVIECPSGLLPGMHRCTFTVRDTSDAPVLDFLGVCETDSMQLLVPSTTSLSFDSVTVGQESAPQQVMITNTSAGMVVPGLQLQVNNDNFLIAAPCQNVAGCDPPGPIAKLGSTTIDVICKPNTAGTHTGSLFVVGTNGFFMPMPIQLQCNGAPPSGAVLTLVPSSIDLSNPVEVRDASAPATIRLENNGTGSLTITGVSIVDNGVVGASDDWTQAFDGQCTTLPCALGADQVLDVRLTFNPSNFNGRPARLIVNYTDPATKQQAADLDGFGQGATLELASSETTLAFGTLPLATPVQKTFVLQNRGNRSTTASLAAAPMAPFTFPATVVVDPTTNPIVNVTCESSSPVIGNSTLTVGAGSDVTTEPFALALECEVRNTLVLSTPSSHSFGEIRQGMVEQSQMFRLTRVGAGSPIMIAAALTDDSNPHVTLGNLTSPQTPADLTYSIDPVELGPFASSITVTPMGMQAISIPVSGSVVTVEATTPPVTSLGTFCVDQPTTPSTLALKVIGTGKLRMPDPPVMMGSPSPFTLELISPPAYPALLDPATEATVIVTPLRGSAAGVVMDTLRWTTEVGERTTTVTTTFVDEGAAIAPDSLVFAPTPIRLAIDNAQQVTLQNCSTAPLELEPPTVPPPFVLDDQFPTLLEPGQRATFSIAFQPTQVGHFEKQLVVTSTADDMFAVTLLGDGISDGGSDDDDGDDLGTTSFYACSSCASNDPSSVLVIALAVVCAFAPRRNRGRRRAPREQDAFR